ncbi:hypothetical protein XYCOK13_14640 [Xylanibacillus composti]|uniref:Basal-body rod modification protein FlgD n=1 Tax=Xylanibacillus composti TaxID=1572762 RepID=A0A8J4M194_9BACL|nr:flagellar hook capping FlgD N-terminal domain-containing protein [Xylanibacillus composti]GIQ68640.1 hypothetical protein XYCOK13_14640 [Xylanibacillus composti]
MKSPIWPVYSKQNMPLSTEERKSNDVLGKDEFLKILITQLQNQDPSQPLQDREFIAQMAQFSSVEQLMNMSKEMGALRQSLGISSDLIGKEVSWLGLSGNSIVEMYGVVDSILFSNGIQYAKIGEHAIPIDEIIRVTIPEQPSPTDPADEVPDPDEGSGDPVEDVEEPGDGSDEPIGDADDPQSNPDDPADGEDDGTEQEGDPSAEGGAA